MKDIAQHLGLSTPAIYKLVERGESAHARVSNAIRFERAWVDELLEAAGRG